MLERGVADGAVCLGDLPDDWGRGYDMQLYEQTYDAAIAFARRHPSMRWWWGNHDLSYWWQKAEGGFSVHASDTVRAKLWELQRSLGDDSPITCVQRVGNAAFSHAGVSEEFVRGRVRALDPVVDVDDVDAVIRATNRLGAREMWDDGTPIWLRSGECDRLCREGSLLHVVGHTSVERPTEVVGAPAVPTAHRERRVAGAPACVARRRRLPAYRPCLAMCSR
ncbi:MAG: hypothetical protein SOI26_09425 [Coriobacteriales bacterium]